MKPTLMEQEHHKMLDIIAALWPEGSERDQIRVLMGTTLAEHYGARWKDTSKCLNCDAKMKKYTYTVNRVVARTLLKLGQHVRWKVEKGEPFTDANKIYMNGITGSLGILSGTENDAKTIMRYHGLLAKYKEDGKQKDSQWVITRRGFAFLNGEAIPAKITVWRGQIVERHEEMITLKEALAADVSMLDGEPPFDWALQEGRIL